MMLRLFLSKGSHEENPRDIRAEKAQHISEVASFASRGTAFLVVMGTAALSVTVALAVMAFMVLGIIFQAFSAF